MSETPRHPRTDAQIARTNGNSLEYQFSYLVDHANQLERELIAAQAALSAAEQRAIVAKDKLAVANDALAIYCNRAREAEQRAEAMRKATIEECAAVMNRLESEMRFASKVSRDCGQEITANLQHGKADTCSFGASLIRALAAIASGAVDRFPYKECLTPNLCKQATFCRQDNGCTLRAQTLDEGAEESSNE